MIAAALDALIGIAAIGTNFETPLFHGLADGWFQIGTKFAPMPLPQCFISVTSLDRDDRYCFSYLVQWNKRVVIDSEIACVSNLIGRWVYNTDIRFFSGLARHIISKINIDVHLRRNRYPIVTFDCPITSVAGVRPEFSNTILILIGWFGCILSPSDTNIGEIQARLLTIAAMA
jgi:hypothetical protein